MSRSGYIYDGDCDDALAIGRAVAAVNSAIRGRRGQALLRELLEALDAMEDKRLYPGSFATADGEYCALGVLGAKRGTKMDDLGNDDEGCDPSYVGHRFGIAAALAAEIMYWNDEYSADIDKWVEVEICGPVRPWYPDYGRHTRSVLVSNPNHAEERWQAMRKWVADQIKADEKGGAA